MTKKQIVRVDDEFLAYGDQWKGEPANPGIKELADFLDGNAEARNNHDFVGLHRILVVFLTKRLGQEKAKELMTWIAQWKGLDSIARDCRAEACAELGVPEPWKDWDIA